MTIKFIKGSYFLKVHVGFELVAGGLKRQAISAKAVIVDLAEELADHTQDHNHSRGSTL